MTHEEWKARVDELVAKLRLTLAIETAEENSLRRFAETMKMASADVRLAKKNFLDAREAWNGQTLKFRRAVSSREYTGAAYAELLRLEPDETAVEPDPPMHSDPDDQALADYIDSLPFKDKMPAFPYYDVPTRDSCDWIISDRLAESMHGQPTYHGPEPMAAAYQLSREAGFEGEIMMGVVGNIGNQLIGYGYGSQGGTLGYKNEAGDYEDIQLGIVGLTADAEMRSTLGDKYGFIDSLRCFNIGFRGGYGNFILSTVDHDPSAQGDIGDVLFDGCWWLNRAEWSEGEYPPHTSGLHLGDHRSLILRRHKFAGFRGREHCLYDKSSYAGPSWIVQNDMRGGNRTWFQRRPDPSNNVRPRGAFVVLLNKGDSYGWDHGSDGASFAGGSAITVWTAPDDTVFIAGNKVIDAKYGCLTVTAQPASKGNWFTVENSTGTELPYVVERLYIWDNVFDNGHVGHPPNLPSRNAVSVAAVKELHIGPNEFLNGAVLALPNEWSMRVAGFDNGAVSLYGAEYLNSVNIRSTDGVGELAVERQMTQLEKEALVVVRVPLKL
tara:strand:+ start:10547 stop:12202 length:1656 start_codon:yes stop_codon:yes gene_type:complete